jgi:hypothetical protein
VAGLDQPRASALSEQVARASSDAQIAGTIVVTTQVKTPPASWGAVGITVDQL